MAEQGQGPLVLLIHGFPELWYSWRHQLPALAEAGYRAVAPDVRGVGQSDAPREIAAYSMREMTADAVGILDTLGVEQAVIVGHDFGAMTAWNCAVLYPQRFRAVVGVSVPFLPRSPAPPTTMFRQIFLDNFFYILYFQEPGVAEAELEADTRRTLRMFMHTISGDNFDPSLIAPKKKDAKFLDGMQDPAGQSDWLTEDDLDYYTAEYERTGFSGGLNRYRNMDRDWEELAHMADAKVEQPALFLAGEKDGVIMMTNPESMKERVTNLTMPPFFSDCGHWTQQEKPVEFNAALIEFLNGL